MIIFAIYLCTFSTVSIEEQEIVYLVRHSFRTVTNLNEKHNPRIFRESSQIRDLEHDRIRRRRWSHLYATRSRNCPRVLPWSGLHVQDRQAQSTRNTNRGTKKRFLHIRLESISNYTRLFVFQIRARRLRSCLFFAMGKQGPCKQCTSTSNIISRMCVCV